MPGQPMKRRIAELEQQLAAMTAERDQLLATVGLGGPVTAVAEENKDLRRLLEDARAQIVTFEKAAQDAIDARATAHRDHDRVPTPDGIESLDANTKNRLIEALKLGMARRHACRFAQLSWRTFMAWMARGTTDRSGPYYSFVREVNEADTSGLFQLLGMMKMHAMGGKTKDGKEIPSDVRALQKMLEYRLRVGNFRGNKERVELTGKGGGPVETQTEVDVQSEWAGLRDTVMRALEPFPEARAAVAAALMQQAPNG